MPGLILSPVPRPVLDLALDLARSAAQTLAPAAQSVASRSYFLGGQAPQGWVLILVKSLFILVIMAGLCLFLRLLFGPRGPLRPREFGTGHIAERRERKARLRELKRLLREKAITRREYLERRWDIDEER